MPLVPNPKKNGPHRDAEESFGEENDFELPVNPEIEQKIADFKKARPRLAEFVKNLPRERLENAYVLQHAERAERFEIYRQKVIAAMDRPENVDLKKQIEKKLVHILDPKVKARMYGRRVMNAVSIGAVKMGM